MPKDPDFWHVDWDEEFSEEITPAQEAAIDKLAKEIAERGMAVPALMFLETVKPLNWIASQVMLFFEPITAWFFNLRELVDLRRAFQKREGIIILIEKIEKYEKERQKRIKAEKEARKKAKLEKQASKTKLFKKSR